VAVFPPGKVTNERPGTFFSAVPGTRSKETLKRQIERKERKEKNVWSQLLFSPWLCVYNAQVLTYICTYVLSHCDKSKSQLTISFV
jgi:hypothetical protein